MIYTKFQGHQFIGSGEEDFKKILPCMGMAGHIDHDHVTGRFGKKIVPSALEGPL